MSIAFSVVDILYLKWQYDVIDMVVYVGYFKYERYFDITKPNVINLDLRSMPPMEIFKEEL